MLRKNVAGQKVCFSLFKSGARIDNPTIAVGDFKVDIDGAGQANVATPPTSDAAGLVTWLPSQAETNGDYITLLGNDVAGAEWEPLTIEFETELPTTIAGLAASFAAIPAAVWGYVTRTITGGGGSAAEVWAYATRTITGGGISAADVWGYISRTLTQTAASVSEAVTGSTLAISIAVTYTATLSGLTIPATWSKMYFSLKLSKDYDDDDSDVQIIESNPGVGTDGLSILMGATGTAAQGSLTVDQSAGTVVIVIADEATATLTKRAAAYYDIKVLLSDGTTQELTEGLATISHVVTRAIT